MIVGYSTEKEDRLETMQNFVKNLGYAMMALFLV